VNFLSIYVFYKLYAAERSKAPIFLSHLSNFPKVIISLRISQVSLHFLSFFNKFLASASVKEMSKNY